MPVFLTFKFQENSTRHVITVFLLKFPLNDWLKVAYISEEIAQMRRHLIQVSANQSNLLGSNKCYPSRCNTCCLHILWKVGQISEGLFPVLHSTTCTACYILKQVWHLCPSKTMLDWYIFWDIFDTFFKS